MKKHILGLFALVCMIFNAYAQDGEVDLSQLKSVKDAPQEVQERYIRTSDEMKVKNYDAAEVDLEWLLANTPQLSKNLYIWAERAYLKREAAFRKAKNTAKAIEFQDKLLALYDTRYKYYGNEKLISLKKARKLFSYLMTRDNAQQIYVDTLLKFYNYVLDLNELKTDRTALAYLMKLEEFNYQKFTKDIKNQMIQAKNTAKDSLVVAQKEELANTKFASDQEAQAFQEKWKNAFDTFNIEWTVKQEEAIIPYDNQLIDIYDRIMVVVNHNIELAKDDKTIERWEKTESLMTSTLEKYIKIDCDYVKYRMKDEIQANPGDLNIQKRALKYMLKAKCLEEELFFEVAQNVLAVEPDVGLTNAIATQLFKREEYDSAISWKQKAIALANEDTIKAKYQLEIASIHSKKGAYKQARTSALEALGYSDVVNYDVYTLLGNMYMASHESCSGENPIETKTVFLAAYDAYTKAGNKEAMSNAKEYFPTAEEIHNFDMTSKIGSSINVICWIGGKTTLRKR